MSIIGAAVGYVAGGAGGAAIGAAVGGAYSASQAGDRAQDAANTASAATQATAAAAEALNRERYEEAVQLLTPYIQSSGISQEALFAQLGLPSPRQQVADERLSSPERAEQSAATPNGDMPQDYADRLNRSGAQIQEEIAAWTPGDDFRGIQQRLDHMQRIADEGGYGFTAEQLGMRQGGLQFLADQGDLTGAEELAGIGERIEQATANASAIGQAQGLDRHDPNAGMIAGPNMNQLTGGMPLQTLGGQGDPLEGMSYGTYTPSAAYEGSTYQPSNYMDYESEFLPEGPGDDYRSTDAYMQSQDAIRQVGDERRASAAQTTGMESGFYGGRRIAAAGEIGGDQALALAGLEQSSMQDYYRRLEANQGMRQQGAGMMSSFNQADLDRHAGQEQFDIRTGRAIEAQDIGRQTAIEQADIMREESRYAGDRGATASAYQNYMSMLMNLASPNTATNLAGMGMGNAATISGQNMAANTQSQNYMMQGVGAQNAATADMFGGLTNMGAAWLGSQA